MASKQMGLARNVGVGYGASPENQEDVEENVLEQIRLLTEQIKSGLATQRQKRDVERYGGALPGTPEWEAKWSEIHRQDRVGRDIGELNQQMRTMERPSGMIPLEDVWARNKGIAVGTPDKPYGTGLKRYEVEEGGQEKYNDLLQRRYALEGLLTKQGLPNDTQRLVPKGRDTSKMWNQPFSDEEGNMFQMGPNGQLVRRMPAQREPQERVNPLDSMEYSNALKRIYEIEKVLRTGMSPDGFTPLTPEDMQELDNEKTSMEGRLGLVRGRYSKLPGTQGGGAAATAPKKKVVRTGTEKGTGRRVVQYEDGTMGYVQ